MSNANSSEPTPSDSPETHPTSIYSTIFLQKLTVITFGVFFAWLLIQLLRDFQYVLKPLFVAIFIAYLIIPIRDWLVSKRVPSLLAAVLILAVVLGILFGVGVLVYSLAVDFAQDWDADYAPALDRMIQQLTNALPFDIRPISVRELQVQLFDQKQVSLVVGQAAKIFLDMFSGLAIIFVYLVFVAAERASLPYRVTRALGEKHGERVLEMFKSINLAITRYLAIKTVIGFLAALMSMVVLYIFGVKYWQIWALFIFLFNYIPYLGSLAATVLPILMSFLQPDIEWWQAIVVAILLIAIQQAFGSFIEPRVAGRRLGVSPILVILSLAFWGSLWGIQGMILAVPILMIIKITLENIGETQPLAILMSNE